MANLRLSALVLKDNWPGVPNLNLGVPNRTKNSKCGWDNTNDNFSTADDTARALNANRTQRLGEKRVGYTDNTNCPGNFTMMYLCMHSFEDGMDVSKDFSDGHFFYANCGPGCASTSEWSDTSEIPYHVVARCTTGVDVTQQAAVAIPCSTYIYSDGTGVGANGYGDGYGWFWVGGVCPCKEITILDDGSGNYKGVDLTVDAGLGTGPVIICETGAAALLMGNDLSNINDATLGAQGQTPTPIGWACVSAA